MPESFIPVWMSIGEAQEFRCFLQEQARTTDGEFPGREFDLIDHALGTERPRSFDEMKAERLQAQHSPGTGQPTDSPSRPDAESVPDQFLSDEDRVALWILAGRLEHLGKQTALRGRPHTGRGQQADAAFLRNLADRQPQEVESDE